jgi:glutaredoxin
MSDITLVWRPGCASCAAAKEFLELHEVQFESVNPVELAGAERWADLGRPRIPSLVLDGATTAIYHVSQVAALLGMTPAQGGDAARLSWDIAALLEAWSDELLEVDWELMTLGTRSRGRTVRNLTVNVHEPIHELTVAWETGVFDWNTELDEERATALGDANELRAYAHARTAEWITFLSGLGDELSLGDPMIRAGDEDVTFSSLLDAQRFHAAFHYRQLRVFLSERNAARGAGFDLARLEGLRLPESVF